MTTSAPIRSAGAATLARASPVVHTGQRATPSFGTPVHEPSDRMTTRTFRAGMLVYPFAADAPSGTRNSPSFAAPRWPVSLTAILIWFVAVASPRSKGKDQTIARMLASKPRVRRGHPCRAGDAAELRRSPYFTVQPS